MLRRLLIVYRLLAIGFIVIWSAAVWQGVTQASDFTAFYSGWAIVRDGHGRHLYDLDIQAQYQQQIFPDQDFAEGVLPLPYLNPPHATLPFVPLAWLSLSTAYLIWSAGQMVLLLWALVLLSRLTTTWSPLERSAMVASVCAFPPLLLTFVLGQYSLVMLICVLQFTLALKQGRERAAGLWLVMGTIKFPLVLLPAMALLGAQRWKAITSAVVLGGTALVVSGMLLSWQSWIGFLQLMATVSRFFGRNGIDPERMSNVRGMLTLLFGSAHGPLINQVSTLALLVGAMVTTVLWYRSKVHSFELRMALTVLLGVICSPHLYDHDTLLLIVPAVLFYDYLRIHNLPRYAYASLVLSYPLVSLLNRAVAPGNLGNLLPLAAEGLLMIWMATYCVRGHDSKSRVHDRLERVLSGARARSTGERGSS